MSTNTDTRPTPAENKARPGVKTRAAVTAATVLLRGIAEKYYLGCKALHICAQAQSPERVQWHARLKTLAQIGNQLADALGEPRPDWKVLYHTAHRYRQLDNNPFHPTNDDRKEATA